MHSCSPFYVPYCAQKKEEFFYGWKEDRTRLLTWVLVLVMALSLLPLNVLAKNGDSNNPGFLYNMQVNLSSDSTEGVSLTYKWNDKGNAQTLSRGESATFRTNNWKDAIYFYVHVPNGYTPGGTFKHTGGASSEHTTEYLFYDNIKEDGSIGEFHYTIENNNMRIGYRHRCHQRF